jgi:hypothetical protein
MTKRAAMGLLVGALGIGAGCGSEAPKPFYLCDKEGFSCETNGLPFVKVVAAVSDYCGGLVALCALPTPPPAGATTANLSKPESGKVCLSGFLAPGGWASLVLPFSEVNEDGTMIVKTFDAASLGIAQVDFTIDSPLTGSVMAGATTTPPAPVPDCPNASCFENFTFGTAPLTGIAATYAAPGPQVAPFANLYPVDGASLPFEPIALENISFSPAAPGDFDFCISGIKFRDAAGNEVRP